MSIKTVDSAGVDRIEIERDMEVECPYDDVTDEYTATISFMPGGETLEYRTFANWLDSFGGSEISQERLCETIHDKVVLCGMRDVRVSLAGEQYGMQVTVEA